MKKKIMHLCILLLIINFNSRANTVHLLDGIESSLYTINKDVPTHFIPSPNLEQIRIEDQKNDKNGMFYRIGVSSFVNLSNQNSGIWSTLSSGDKSWQLAIKNPGAEALSFIFKTFKLSEGSSFFVQTKEGKRVSDVLTKDDLLEDLQQNVALCFGDELVLTLIDKRNNTPSELILDRVIYNYRSTGNPKKNKINESDATCEVNVNCSEGNNYQDEKKGVVRIYVVGTTGAGWCSGSLVNNLANDCKPYVLTALHCGPSVHTTTANMLLWKFYFNYEAPTCVNPTSVGTLASKYVSSCLRIADSNDNDGTNISKSDFLLVQIGTLANETTTIGKIITYGGYWNGWDANTSASASGVSIHHPSGDIKKISTYTSSLTNSTWPGSITNFHWQVSWAATANGHGVTEGGSSGSPIFTYNNGSSRIVGTLSGGSSFCTATSSPDLYGKMSCHWTSDGSASNQKLKTFLDPNNTGTLVLDGSFNPCNYVGIKEQIIEKEISIYPNPTFEQLSIDLTSISGENVTIEIYDLMGKLIYSTFKNSDTLIEINMESYMKGIYNVYIHSDEINLVKRISKN